MRDLYRSLLTAVGVVLALWLILGFWALSAESRVMLSLLVILLGGVTLWRQCRIPKAGRMTAKKIVDDSLPPEDFQGVVILVCGDNTALFSEGTHHRETRQGWYLRVKTAGQLPALVRELSQMRPALVSQISVMFAVLPERHTSDADFPQRLRGWQRAVVQCRVDLGRFPPVWIVAWVSPPAICTGSEPVWFSATSNRTGIQVYPPNQGCLPLGEWAQEARPDEQLSRLSQGLWLDSLLAWQETVVNRLLSIRQRELPALQFCAQGVCMAPVSAVAGNLWQQHIGSVTALSPETTDNDNLLPLPERLLLALPRRRGVSRRMVLWRYAGLMGGIFLTLAMLASWVNNQRLIRHIDDHLALYRHLGDTPFAPKLRAQQRLRADAARLDDWQRRGEPVRYRLGLYQGQRLLPVVEEAVNDWVPSMQPERRAEPVRQPESAPHIIRLDSLSLFDSGTSSLKPGSTKMLVNSLVGIRAKPGWLIVVSGHTD
ncbi:OmpA family protein, partial [Citrobacter sp. JGM124]|uniref:OmpA family protein n=1 Tax=Citrobacter sp. JGM124 TaxID=2799789 RepID=UPI001BADEA83